MPMKKNQLKKRAMSFLSPMSVSSNWSEPKPETLDLSPHVPSAVRYSPRYSTPIDVQAAGMAILTVHVEMRSAGFLVEP
jgi:hypothetical protein